MNLSVRFSNPKHVKHVIARVIACSIFLVLPSCGIPNLRKAVPGPVLPANYVAGFNGAASSENSSQVPIEDFFNDPMLTRLIDQELVGSRERKILAQDVKDDADEPLTEIVEHKAGEARACESDRLQHPAGSAVLWSPRGSRDKKPRPPRRAARGRGTVISAGFRLPARPGTR